MSLKEGLKFQKRLREKIESYRKTEHYGKSKTGKAKTTRSLDLLNGTNPEVLQSLGVDTVPDAPEEAMNLVRNQDLKIVKATEIFDVTGEGKHTGHHGTPASLLRAVGVLDPDDQDYVFNTLKDWGIKHGMDPGGILAIEGKRVHGKIAHGGDWTGRRTGAFLDPKPGESGKDFIKRFEGAYNIQMDQNERAIADSLTQDWQGAMRGAADGLDVPELDINSTTTPASQRSDLTKILKPSAKEVKAIVESNAGNPAQIRKATEQIVRNTPITKHRQGLVEELRRTSTASPTNITPGQRFGRKGLGKLASKVPVAGGILAGGLTLLNGGGVEAAVGDFIDAENPLDGGALADGTVTGWGADERNRPLHYGKNGPNVPRPGQREHAERLRINPTSERGYETIARKVTDTFNHVKSLLIGTK